MGNDINIFFSVNLLYKISLKSVKLRIVWRGFTAKACHTQLFLRTPFSESNRSVRIDGPAQCVFRNEIADLLVYIVDKIIGFERRATGRRVFSIQVYPCDTPISRRPIGPFIRLLLTAQRETHGFVQLQKWTKWKVSPAFAQTLYLTSWMKIWTFRDNFWATRKRFKILYFSLNTIFQNDCRCE